MSIDGERAGGTGFAMSAIRSFIVSCPLVFAFTAPALALSCNQALVDGRICDVVSWVDASGHPRKAVLPRVLSGGRGSTGGRAGHQVRGLGAAVLIGGYDQETAPGCTVDRGDDFVADVVFPRATPGPRVQAKRRRPHNNRSLYNTEIARRHGADIHVCDRGRSPTCA
jgi:hypothetical protein